MLMIDTCFLIDYQREVKQKRRGPVASFLQAQTEERLQISPVAWGEFLSGFAHENDAFIDFVRDRLDFVPLDFEASSTYRRVYRSLKVAGTLIGSNDLWIASHALSREQALVTRNSSDFRRIPELRLVEY
jgi:tRNA(fMet)-specific endonuclease VapC